MCRWAKRMLGKTLHLFHHFWCHPARCAHKGFPDFISGNVATSGQKRADAEVWKANKRDLVKNTSRASWRAYSQPPIKQQTTHEELSNEESSIVSKECWWMNTLQLTIQLLGRAKRSGLAGREENSTFHHSPLDISARPRSPGRPAGAQTCLWQPLFAFV